MTTNETHINVLRDNAAGLTGHVHRILAQDTLKQADLIALFDFLKSHEEEVETAVHAARAKVLALLQAGRRSPTGTLECSIDGWRLSARPRNTGYDDRKTEALLRAKSLALDTYMDKQTKYKANAAKLESAVNENKILPDELEVLKADPVYNVMRPVRCDE